MAMKFKYGAKEEIPAEQVSLYAEREGERVLDCDGVADKIKLDEFRSHNVALRKQVEDLQKRYEGIDPDEVRKLAEQKQRFEEERHLKAGEVDKVVENRIKVLVGAAWRLVLPCRGPSLDSVRHG
jgi:hypothetical protein